MRPAALCLLCAIASGCARAVPAPRLEGAATAPQDNRDAAQRFAAWERLALSDLATVDPRLSLRLRLVPTEAEAQRATLGSLLEGDTGLRVIDGRADIFSFDARARELAALAKRTEARPPVRATADESDFEEREVALLARTVSEERARVDEERQLPRSGSALLRGIVVAWASPTGMSQLKERDDWLAARLEELRAAADRAPLRAVEISELEDAIDPLEHLIDPLGFARAEAALARLRIALGAERAATTGGIGWEELQRRLAIHLGMREQEAELRSEIERTESRLRDEASTRLSRIPEDAAIAVGRTAAGHLLVEGACEYGGRRSPIRSAAPPPERSAVCGALQTIAVATTESDATAALIAVHDAVAVAQWALAIHLDDADAGRAPEGHRLMGDVPPEREARLVRFAATRPIECIAVARMAALLDVHGKEDRQRRAKRWLADGDAPFDFVERDLDERQSPPERPAN